MSGLLTLLQAAPGLTVGMTVEGVLVWVVSTLLLLSGVVIKVLWSDNKALRDKQEARADAGSAALTTLANALEALGRQATK